MNPRVIAILSLERKMQHDDDDDNAIAREIIKEIRARKHKGEIRESDHYQPEDSGKTRGCCP